MYMCVYTYIYIYTYTGHSQDFIVRVSLLFVLFHVLLSRY